MAPLQNPIIPGFNPDPSICLVDGIFYLATSSFLAFPGIPIYASKDLVNWVQIGNVVTRNSQMDMSPYKVNIRGESGGVWAPTIRFHDNLFHVIVSCVVQSDDMDWYDDSRFHGFIFTCPDPFSSEWSDPVRFDFPGFDTSLFWDTDGKCYLQGTQNYTNFSLRQISQFEIDLKTGKSLSGPPKFLWEGTGGIFPEAPHIFLKDGYYYLLIAEGGTYMDHSARLARATNVWGPYESCPHNPVLQPPPSSELIQTIGHADFIEDEDGNWWAVALGTRIHTDNSSPMGRESFLIEGSWPPGVAWPTFTQPVKRILSSDNLPEPQTLDRISRFQHMGPRGAFSSFPTSKSLALHWVHYRNPSTESYQVISPRELALIPSLATLNCRERVSPTFVGIRQTSRYFVSSVVLAIPTSGSGAVDAGLTVFLDDIRHAEVLLTASGKIQFRRTTMGTLGVPAPKPLTLPAPLIEHSEEIDLPSSTKSEGKIKFNVTVSENASEFIFGFESMGKVREVGRVKAVELSVGFCGTIIGVFATTSSEHACKSGGRVIFSDFEYREYEGLEE